ncbi:MAG: hypothetical protein WB729_14805 [Candidatus Sulfotelmatobacter sp.]
MKLSACLLVLIAFACAAQNAPAQKPIVYLAATSAGNTWGAVRNQSHEMEKDFVRDCPEAQLTEDSRNYDYAVKLNHIEVGLLVRDNQFSVTDMFGSVLSAKEGNSIKKGAKAVCALVLADWSNQTSARDRLVAGINASFQRDGALGYSEMSGDKLTVHSERAGEMRFHMILASRELSLMQRSGVSTFFYTDDHDQNFAFDVKAGRVVTLAQSSSVVPTSTSPVPAAEPPSKPAPAATGIPASSVAKDKQWWQATNPPQR